MLREEGTKAQCIGLWGKGTMGVALLTGDDEAAKEAGFKLGHAQDVVQWSWGFIWEQRVDCF